MSFNKVRYVTVCQQLLATAAVLATGVTAAGVLPLDIVTPAPQTAEQRFGVESPGPSTGQSLTQKSTASKSAVRPIQDSPAPADVKPVQATVREVIVAPVATAPETAPETAPATDPTVTDEHAADPGMARVLKDPATTEGVDSAKELAVLSKPEKVTGYATVGVTWKSGTEIADDDIRVQVRSLKDGQWSDWADADYHDEHGPDPLSGEAKNVRPGTDALVVGDVEKVQMRAETTDGVAPEDVQLALIDPGVGTQTEQAPRIDTNGLAADTPASEQETAGSESESGAGEADAAALQSSDGPISLSAMAVAPRPTIYSRAQWGANEAMRDRSSLHYGDVRAGFVHHTVNANSYSRAQVPSLIRGIYAYHTQSRGWSDIGYNFLVDRFGRIWEGRYGGVARNPVGAHTLGYNDVSFAMSAIGNFEIARPPAAVATAYGKLMAWKLSLNGVKANATRVNLHGKYFNAINGHRDAGSTACPGRYLYAQIPAIRTKATTIQHNGAAPTPPTPPAYSPTQTPATAVTQPRSVQFPSTLNLTGSSRPDLVVSSGDDLRVLRMGGVTGFNQGAIGGPSWNGFKSHEYVGDLTGDGRPEFINRGQKTGSARVFSANRDGKLRGISGTGTMRFRHYSQLAGIGDLTGDGKADVVGRNNRTGALRLFPGRGNGTFDASIFLSRTLAKNSRGLWTAGDITGDNHGDLVFRDGNGAIWVAAGRTRGFAAPTRLPVISQRRFIGVGDLNADGIKDLVFATGNSLYALRGRANGAYLKASYGPIAGPTQLAKRVLADVSGSRQADVVGFNRDGRPVVAAHNGQRTFSRTFTAASGISKPSAVLNVGDWDGDGKNDVITRHSSGDMLILRRGRGDGTFRGGLVMSRGWKSVGQLTAVGDVTGDGHGDLIGRIGNTAMRIFPGDGARNFKKPQWAPRYIRTFGRFGDLNWRTFEVPNSIYPSRAGTFVPIGGPSPTAAMRARVASPSYDIVIGVGDVNADGHSDLVMRDKATGVLWLQEGNGTGAVVRRTYLGNGFGGYTALG